MNEIEKKLKVLSKIAAEFNHQKLTWAIGASLLLYIKGMVFDFHDIDIMVAEEDVEKAKKILVSFGSQLPANPKGQYKTKCFLEFQVDGVDIDIIAGFTILRDGTDHYFPLKKGNIRDCAEINGTMIPLQSIAEWRTYYRLMDRSDKVEIIDRTLKPGTAASPQTPRTPA